MPGVRIISAAAPSARRGFTVGAYVAAFYLGSLVSLWASGVLLPSFDWRGAALTHPRKARSTPSPHRP